MTVHINCSFPMYWGINLNILSGIFRTTSFHNVFTTESKLTTCWLQINDKTLPNGAAHEGKTLLFQRETEILLRENHLYGEVNKMIPKLLSNTVEPALRGRCITGSPALSRHLFGLHWTKCAKCKWTCVKGSSVLSSWFLCVPGVTHYDRFDCTL